MKTLHKFCLALLFFPLFCFVVNAENDDFESSLDIENTNILFYDERSGFTDFNRLRFEANIQSIEIPELTAKIIIDNETIYTESPSSLKNSADFYRGGIRYLGEKHFLSFGRQRIPFGVGRIWTPIDIFNPLDSTSIEPDEREGTDSLRYEYNINELSQLDITLSKTKGAFRAKGFLDYADIAIIGLTDNQEDRVIIGWELEGELHETGIEIRSEGGLFYHREQHTHHTEFILGAEYGFPGSLTLLGEYYYDESLGVDRIGATLSYQATPLLFISLLTIINMDDDSTFTAPTFSYSLGDEITLSGGVFIYQGDSDDEFGSGSDLLYMNVFIHF